MSRSQIISDLLEIFGDKVARISEDVCYAFLAQGRSASEQDEIKQRIEATPFFDCVETRALAEGVMILVPYQQLQEARAVWQVNAGDTKSLLAEILDRKQPETTKIHVPIPDSLDADDVARKFNEHFSFDPAVCAEDSDLVLTIPQFQTVQSLWQQHAKSDPFQGFFASLLAQGHTAQPAHGSAKLAEDEAGGARNRLVEALSAAAEKCGSLQDLFPLEVEEEWDAVEANLENKDCAVITYTNENGDQVARFTAKLDQDELVIERTDKGVDAGASGPRSLVTLPVEKKVGLAAEPTEIVADGEGADNIVKPDIDAWKR